MGMRTEVAAVAMVVAASLGTAHGEPLSASDHSAGIGGDVMILDRKLELSGNDTNRIDFDGNLAGVHGYFQRGALFRIEGRVMSGSLDVESDDVDETEPALFSEARATFGSSIGDGGRAYAGVALDSLRVNGSGDAGDFHMWSVYAPVGYSTAGDFARHWRAIARLEGRYVVVGQDRIEDFDDGDDTDFHRRGGFGLAAAVTFRSKDAPLEIQPYLEVTEYSNSQTETVAGEDFSTEDQRSAAGGVRVHWLF